MNRIRKFLRGSATAPAVEPLPVPADGDTSASHMRHAHQRASRARLEHGRWLSGCCDIDLDAVDDDAADAIERLRSFRSCLASERAAAAAIKEA